MLNRYFDAIHQPRAEMFATDEELSAQSGRDDADFFLNIRAACESGWDFSSRWLGDGNSLRTIETAHILPVDLNCLLWNLEDTISKAYSRKGHKDLSLAYLKLAEQRAGLLQTYCWDEQTGYYYDYHFTRKEQLRDRPTLAGAFPLFFRLASETQGKRSAEFLLANFLRKGGLVTTPVHSGQQWDAPNAWAPLQWIAYRALTNYDFEEAALDLAWRWLKLNEAVFKRTGKLLEKYNVEDTTLLSGGGEYPVQDGFGWTNGVLLRMMKELEDK